ncbi:putative type VI secretion system effector [Intestinirhabdus alba]|uniref:putative type VI secretion system effector n=1 Tax=Intestinirhabdus alba TaxID=2899544 RepID=UPI002ED7DFCE
MAESGLRFSDIPRCTYKELEKIYPIQNYLKTGTELHRLQREIRRIESTRGRRDQLPALRRQAQKLEEALAKAPPDPVLPPPVPLIKVKGVLEKFKQRCVMHYFDTEAYPHTHEYLKRQREREESAALVMGATGSGAAAQGMLLQEGRIPNHAWHVTGVINGRRFSGWLGSPFCQEGEEVELIVAPVGGEYLVYAVHKPWERSLIMPPFCYRGVRQGRKSATFSPLGVFFFIMLVLIITSVISDGWGAIFTYDFYRMLLVFISFSSVIYLLPAIWTIWRRYPFPREELSEEIFTVLGWENVSDINLSKLNRRRKRQWKRTGKPENPFKDYTPFKCSGMAFGFFYY